MTHYWRILPALLLYDCATAYAATPSFQDKAQLTALLKNTPPCCVIDARSLKNRNRKPIAGALPYANGMKIQPASPVVVVADNNTQAMSAANGLAEQSAQPIYAVKGGVAAWKRAQTALQQQAQATKASVGFVIPHDTCQQGEPLQVFKSAPGQVTQGTTK